MTERREIKQRSQAVWDRVKAAYLAGEPAASVARRFDVGLGNLRFRANKEGWTRRAAMAQVEVEEATETARLAGRAEATQPARLGPPADPSPEPPPADPAAARDAAIGRAAALLAQGRAAEATTLLKAAETLSRLAAELPPPPPPEPTPEEDEAAQAAARAERDAHVERTMKAIEAHYRDVCLEVAGAMLTEQAHMAAPESWALACWHWRARVLGPEIALADFAQGVNGGWADLYWDAVGRLHPLETDIPEPEAFMVRQHLRPYPEADVSGWPWNGATAPADDAEDATPSRGGGPRARLA